MIVDFVLISRCPQNVFERAKDNTPWRLFYGRVT